VSLRLREEGGHPSRFALDRFAAGEGDAAERAALQAHLDACQACRQTVEGLESFRQDFAQHHDKAGFLADVRDRAAEPERIGFWQAWWRPVMALSAAAAAVLIVLLVARPWSGPDSDPDGVRIKSDELELGFLVMEQGRPVVAQPGRVVHPGDRIQFRLSAPRGGFVHVVGVDQAGKVSVYYPRPDEASEPYPGGSGRPVPGSVILDATLGRERVFALICERPLGRARLAQRVRAAVADPRIFLDRDRLPVACVQTSLVLVKEPRP